MFNVSNDFLNALKYTHQTYAVLTAYPLSGNPVTLRVQSGTVTAIYQQGTRRTSDLTIYASGAMPDGSSVSGTQVTALLKRPGTTCLLEAGISSTAVSKTMIPMITGVASNVSYRVGDGMIDMSIADDWWRVAQGRFTSTWTPNAGIKRRDAVALLMQQVAPNRQTVNAASDMGSIQSQGDWGVDRDNAINTLCTDGGFDAYFDRQGHICLSDTKTVNSSPVWSMQAGENGIIETIETGIDVNRLYNTVVVKPSATDNSQNWAPQIASLVTGDRAPANLGVTIPYFIASPTISTANDALRVANNRLSYVTGTAETLQSSAIGNLALDEGDVIQILVPGSELDGTIATMWQYYVDTLTWDLASGSMTLKARNEGQVSDDAE